MENNIHQDSQYPSAHYYDMIVFCHLRWQFVYQRPQHVIERLSHHLKVLFVEEPLPNSTSHSSGNLIVVNDNLHILQPNVEDVKSIAKILPEYVNNKSIPFGWFYSASFSPLLEELNFQTVVYDCMDEPSLIKGDSQELLNQEEYLMSHADIIFTNVQSLFESKKQHHPNVHLFPGSVDKTHFNKAWNSSTPEDIAHIQSPIVGYYGIIDEQIDFSLLQETALKLPNVSFVMIGPRMIDEEHLPKEANIHFLEMKSYDELPNYLKAFDIAMMPFVLNDATKYISPTKTLEYMAAGKPIISTKTTDVVRDYRRCVSLVENADEFSNAITFLLDKMDRLSLEMEYYRILKKTSWDATTDKMESLIRTFSKDNMSSVY